MVKYSKDKETGEVITKYAPTLKFKVQRHSTTNDIQTDVYDHNKNQIEEVEETLSVKGLNLKMLINPTVFWVSGGKFGLSWAVKQIKIDKSSAIKGYAFMSDSDDEQDEQDEQDEEDEQDDTQDDKNQSLSLIHI